MNLLTFPQRSGMRQVQRRSGYAPLRWLRQCGFTLVELSVSMAIGAILVVASLEVMRQELEQTQVGSSSSFLQQTVISLQNFFASDDGAAVLDNSTLAHSAAVARQYVGTGTGAATQINNTWGGRLFVGPLDGDPRTSWVLQVSGLPMRLCSDIVQNLEASLNVRHSLAGAAIPGSEITRDALGSVSLSPGRVLSTRLANVRVLKDTPFSPINPAAMSSLCETNLPYFNLFITGNKHAL